jgi:OmpA-OmpF porin, OOP family
MNSSKKNHFHYKSKILYLSNTRILFLIMALFFSGISVQAQILKKLKKRVEKTAERKIIEKTDKEAGKAMDSILNPKSKKKDVTNKSDNTEATNKKVLVRGNGNNTKPPPTNENESNSNNTNQSNANQDLQPWSKYNFVAGDEIIFQDDLINEESGEFPSRWDLTKGSAENASFEGENIINFENNSIITPLMETDKYLPEVFTIEFDVYFDQQKMDSYVYHQIYKLRFWNGDSYIKLPNSLGTYNPIKVYRYGATLSGKIKGQKKDFKGFEESLKEKQPLWRHIAIAFNKRSLKVFVDQYRALNIPNLGFKPKMVSIEAYRNTYIKEPYVRAIKNIRIAEGGKKLYDRVMADGKFVTRGILFDVNKASIKPESMGVINEVVKMMQEHPDLNFRIEGHTDSDGADDYNLQLSQKRAVSVKQALVNLGINSSRMETKGLGESIPVSDNTSPEGKANNRRVEFIKI